MSRKTLLREYDVIEYTGISLHFPPCDLRTIRMIELKEFRTCLGKDFYSQLLDDLAHYEYEPYDKEKTYSEGNTVVFEGLIYQAKSQTTHMPTNVNSWSLAPRFTTPCYEDLWCEGSLGEYLSWSVLRKRLPFIYTSIQAEGVIKKFGQGFQSADAKDLTQLAKAVQDAYAMSFENLDDYMVNHNEEGCFNLYKGLAVDCCGECGQIECGCEKSCLTNKKKKLRYEVA